MYQENQKLMDIAIREIDRLNRLISEFLEFVKPDKFKCAPVDIQLLVQDLLTALQQVKDFKTNVTVENQLEAKVMASANAEKIKQVVWNLLMNAVQSMPRPGTIVVGCTQVHQNRVKFWVSDQGLGMSEEVLAHLYEPFFTTKEKGTGLGLATAYKIIEAHHGEIRVSSQVGTGSKFEVYLPAA